MFIVGFGTGKAFGQPTKPNESKATQSDYTPNSSAKPGAKSKTSSKTAEESTEEVGETSPVPTNKKIDQSVPESSKPVEGQPCIVKGNISSSSKIYHVKGGASYEKVVPEACFNTEAEAVAAGFRKAKR